MAKSTLKSKEAGDDRRVLAWHQSLATKLGVVFLLLLALLVGGAYLANRALVRDGLLDESHRYEQAVAQHAADTLDSRFRQMQALAVTLARLAANPAINAASLGAVIENGAESAAASGLMASVGVWPSPDAALSLGNSPQGFFWQRDGRGGLTAQTAASEERSGYPKASWYTVGRFVGAGEGYWTPLRRDIISRASVITYITPITVSGRFAGVVTVSVSVDALREALARLQKSGSGYAVLLDGQQKLLGSSPEAEKLFGGASIGQSLSQLGQANASLNPLAVTLFKGQQAREAATVKSSRYQATEVSAYKDASRGLSRQEAEAALLSIWGRRRGESLEPEQITLEQDPILEEASNVKVFRPMSDAWHLLLVAPANSGFAGVSYVFTQALIATMVLVTLTLLLVYLSLRSLVIRPLRQFAEQLEGSNSIEEALTVTLDESARNEVGVLAYWQNERTRQLAEALSSARAAKARLSNESGERKQLEDQLARSQERSSLALQSVGDAVIITDEQGLVEDVNPAAEQLTGVSARQARGRALEDILSVQLVGQNTPPPNFAQVLTERGSKIDYPDDLLLTSITGVQQAISLSAAPMRMRGRVCGIVVVFRPHDASVRNPALALTSEAQGAFTKDLTTGLPTRAACERRIDTLLDQARLSGQQGAVIFVDVDHLKRVNDFGGHTAGDEVLVRIAETLAGAAPQSHDVYRLAADQFAILAENVSPMQAMEVAEALRAQLAATRFYWESRYFSMTGSFGVCPISRDQPGALEVIRRADDACAAAKRAGRNNAQLYESGMDRVGRVVDDEAWVRCIRRGIEEDLFHLRTQWIMPSSEFAAEGHAFEVLLALEDEEGFWASPAAFLPVAERHHMTEAIDRWVISTCLTHLEANPQLVKTMAFCAINLSSQSIVQPGFLDFMVAQLEHRPGLASKLCIEVRERSLTDHPKEALPCLDALHRMGCKISVDHYIGRYMSDLTLLRRLPVDFVKVDALSFKSLSGDPVEQMLAESTLRIAHHLRRRVIISGIEDPRAQETWRKLGANYFQGFAFAKPSPVVFLPPD